MLGAVVKKFVTSCCHHSAIAYRPQFAVVEFVKWFEPEHAGFAVSLRGEASV